MSPRSQVRPPTSSPSTSLQSKHAAALMRRHIHIQKRQLRLMERAQIVQTRVQLAHQKRRLEALRLRTRLWVSQRGAELRRDLWNLERSKGGSVKGLLKAFSENSLLLRGTELDLDSDSETDAEGGYYGEGNVKSFAERYKAGISTDSDSEESDKTDYKALYRAAALMDTPPYSPDSQSQLEKSSPTSSYSNDSYTVSPPPSP
ncbi:hypothetical protein HDV05_001012, partial [Chytridiales sp. JEL 0842]